MCAGVACVAAVAVLWLGSSGLCGLLLAVVGWGAGVWGLGVVASGFGAVVVVAGFCDVVAC